MGKGLAPLAAFAAAAMLVSVPATAQASMSIGAGVSRSVGISRSASLGGKPSNPKPLDVSGIVANVNGSPYARWNPNGNTSFDSEVTTAYDYNLCNAYPNGATVSFSNVPSDWQSSVASGVYGGKQSFSITFIGKNSDGVLMATRSYMFTCATLKSDIPEFTPPSSGSSARTWRKEGVAWMAPASGGRPVYRLFYQPRGWHHYTMDEHERDVLAASGWKVEKIAFNADLSGRPVYRVFNPVSGEHHYTMDGNERNVLVGQGWHDEGVAWYVGDSADVPVYRVHNPVSGEHLWTTDYNEYETLGNTPVEPEPAPSPAPGVQQGITPGAYCTPEGATGVSAQGVTYTCKRDNDGKVRWRR